MTWEPVNQTEAETRPVLRSLLRGLRCRCPQCGHGRMFGGFTKPVSHCATCGEDLSHQRADDFPAYLNIFVVGHIVVPAFVIVERVTDWPMWMHMAVWVPMTIILALVLLQPIKGAVIAMQWALRMHGFGGQSDEVHDEALDG